MMIDDRVMALIELSNDMLYHKIPAERLDYYVDTPLAIGRETAALYAGRDILEMYGGDKIAIVSHPAGTSKYGVTLRGQAVMGKDECRVELYEASIRALSGCSAFDELPAPDYDTAMRIHLAHEFFHFWEFKNGRVVTEEMDSVVSLRLFGLSRRSKINRCSEVAAHAFAKELLGLPCLPNLYDYSYLISDGKMSREAFDQKAVDARHALQAA